MARTGYQYGTSPRKLEPDYTRKPKQKRKQLKVVEDIPRQQIKVSKEQRKRQMKTTVIVAGLFLLLLTISCRNSQIDKQFNQIQNQKKQLAALQKDNEHVPEDQLRKAASMAVCKINIDSDLRLAMTAGIRKHFNDHPDHFDPRQYVADGRTNIKAIVSHKIKEVLGCDGKA